MIKRKKLSLRKETVQELRGVSGATGGYFVCFPQTIEQSVCASCAACSGNSTPQVSCGPCIDHQF